MSNNASKKNRNSPVFKDIIEEWQNDYIDKLKKIQKINFEFRKIETDLTQEILSFLKELLDALDAFEKTIEQIQQALPPDDKKSKRILGSFVLLHKQIVNVLKKFNITPMEIENTEVVSGLCKVVGTEPSDTVADGSVIRVIKQGYFWKNLILRSAEVIVAASLAENQKI